jgi:hypothetical protein
MNQTLITPKAMLHMYCEHLITIHQVRGLYLKWDAFTSESDRRRHCRDANVIRWHLERDGSMAEDIENLTVD